MAISFVQKALKSNAASTTTNVVTFSAAGTGNFITGEFNWQSTTTTGLTVGSTTTVIKDNNGVNAFVVALATEPAGPCATVIYRFANVSGSPTSITFTIPGGATVDNFGSMQEWSGVATSSPEDGTATIGSNGTISTTQTSPSMTTTVAGDLLVGYLGASFSGVGPITAASFSSAGSGSTLRNNDATNDLGADSSEIQTAAGASTASFTLSSAGQYQVGIAAFKAATGTSNPVLNFDWPNPKIPAYWNNYLLSNWANNGNSTLPQPSSVVLMGQIML